MKIHASKPNGAKVSDDPSSITTKVDFNMRIETVAINRDKIFVDPLFLLVKNAKYEARKNPFNAPMPLNKKSKRS
ncbi:hypothetical protein [Marivirga sericea]|uniref:hypothetical protein n=1 Tax=Marivirga sericea TaxID=1028 RepID=UPI000A1C9644|nr:hypothetical protein [Marivirga sericea]